MKKIITLLFLVASYSLFSQDFSMELVKNMKPRNIGPGGMSGRVTSIAVVEANPEIMYVGYCFWVVFGNLILVGIKWEPIFRKKN